MNFDKIRFLPLRLINLIVAECENIKILEEIRIRRLRNAYIVADGRNISINIIISDEEMNKIIEQITRGSLYAFRDTIINGYIILDDGIRVGIIGSASVEDGRIVGVYDINEIAIRIPNMINVDTNEIFNIIFQHSALIYAPPGIGKTTLLRALIKRLASGAFAKRIGVIDTRGELSFGRYDKEAFISFLHGYPRRIGIEIAVRTMNSQILICDEIGGEEDSLAIIDTQGAGVPIVATCHGNSVTDILSHTGIRRLHINHIFDYYIGIERDGNCGFIYSVNDWEDANVHI